jgi:hypothetical protein
MPHVGETQGSRFLKPKVLQILLVFSFAGVLRGSAARLESIPADLPLRASAPNKASWLAGANILQPYARSQFSALMNVGDRPQRLKNEFGFNAMIVLPTESHNFMSEPRHHLTDAQFREGVAAYRDAGYRLILYTSVMAIGLTPEFQSGRLSRAHPDWVQRDPKGNPIMVYGVPWLCPSTPARGYALDYALRIAREYQPDGIMLDNNQFFFTEAGWTCHCAACTKGFREYARKRLGDERTTRLFGVAPERLEIPAQEGPLHALWLHWRNRAWAEVNESFRASLRKLNPRILLFANTQYGFDNGVLATDLQYEREDVVLSESCALNSWQMSEKMVLGHALAEGRPLWNYIGTFVNGGDYTGLLPREIIGPMISATLAHEARPWIVDGFDEGQTNVLARREMSDLLGWHAAHPELFADPPWAAVCVVVSPTSRNLLHRPLIPPHLGTLLKAGTPAAGLRDENISMERLSRFRVVTIETAGCLKEKAADALARWVRKGGVLIASSDVGDYDELGRKRTRSVLWQALGFSAAPGRETKVGRGKVLAPESSRFAEEAVKLTSAHSFRLAAGSGIEVVPYLGAKSLVLQIIRHEPPAQPVMLHLPGAFTPRGSVARLFIPGSDDPQRLPLASSAEGFSFVLTNVPPYGVVRVSLRQGGTDDSHETD